MTPELLRHRDGASLRTPEGWTVLDLGEQGVVAGEPVGGTVGFRANLVLDVSRVGDLSFRDWQAQADRLLPHMLADYRLLDLERMEVAGRPGGRRLAHHVDRDGLALVMEQWFTLHGDRGVTLTATIEAPRYGGAAPTFDAAAASLRLEPR